MGFPLHVVWPGVPSCGAFWICNCVAGGAGGVEGSGAGGAGVGGAGGAGGAEAGGEGNARQSLKAGRGWGVQIFLNK